MNPTILIIDDEESVRKFLRLSLELSQFRVITASTGSEGLKQLQAHKPQLVLLDLGLPDIQGLDVLRQIRAWSSVPVIVLTVTENETTKVDLLDEGADDYLTKPFGIAELNARIRVALRHRISKEENFVFQSGPLEVDLSKQQAKIRGEPIKLTATEWKILRLLIMNQGRVVTQKQLLREIWGPHAEENSHYLRIYISHLRQKLKGDPALQGLIQTEAGIGYRLLETL